MKPTGERYGEGGNGKEEEGGRWRGEGDEGEMYTPAGMPLQSPDFIHLTNTLKSLGGNGSETQSHSVSNIGTKSTLNWRKTAGLPSVWSRKVSQKPAKGQENGILYEQGNLGGATGLRLH